MADLLPMIELVAENDELSVADCARIIKAVSDSILRQTK